LRLFLSSSECVSLNSNSSVLKIAEGTNGAPLIVQGNIAFGGNLLVSLLRLLFALPKKRAVTTQQIEIATFGSSKGTFNSLEVTGFDSSPCNQLQSSPVYGPR
jgi:hypothetical protein